MTAIARPDPAEYNEYYGRYIALVPDGDVLALMGEQPAELADLLGGLTAEEGHSRFAPGEWTINEVVGHLIDVERIFAYRAFCIARNDPSALPGFDQDDYVAATDFNAVTLPDLLDELALLRRANLLAFRRYTPDLSARLGTASGYPFSVRAVIYVMAGHHRYHVADLTEKYLPAIGR